MRYDDSYATTAALFGEGPVPLLVNHWEALGREHRHGDRPPERRALIEAVLSRNQPGHV